MHLLPVNHGHQLFLCLHLLMSERTPRKKCSFLTLGNKRLLELEYGNAAWQRFQGKVSIKMGKNNDYLEL